MATIDDICPRCGKPVPAENMLLHLTRCTAASLEPPALRRTSTDDMWRENVEDMLTEVLKDFPEIQESSHPANVHLLQARDAQERMLWDVAFNEVFTMQALASESADNAAAALMKTPLQQTPHSGVPDAASLDRSVSTQVAEAVGEPSKELVRMLLDEEGGDEALAMDRALLMHDLESKDDFQLELNEEPLDCSICITEAPVRHALRLHPCGHGWYCIDCVQHYVDTKLGEGLTRSSLRCPDPSCGRLFSERILQALLTRQQLERMHRQDLEAAVAAYANIRPCPTPDCPNRVVLEDGVEPRLSCSMCHKEHCLLCSATPYHEGKTCEEHLASLRAEGGEGAEDAEASLRKWMNEVGAKQCPNCGSVVTKQFLESQATQSRECHKMICRSCRVKFCFGCLAILTETFTCGCTPDSNAQSPTSHGFIDPESGRFVSHGFRRQPSSATKAKAPPPATPSKAPAPKQLAAVPKRKAGPPPFKAAAPKRRSSPAPGKARAASPAPGKASSKARGASPSPKAPPGARG